MTRSCLCAVLALGTLAACVDTGVDQVAFPLYVAGTDHPVPITAFGNVAVTIDEAQLAFGPLYLCAGTQAGALCDTARVEWLESALVAAHQAAPVQAGMLGGTSGGVRSWMYDLGLPTLLTRDDPLVLNAAMRLGGNSVRIAGRVAIDGLTVPFSVALPITQEQAQLGVPVVRKGSSEPFAHDIAGDSNSLLVRFDPAPWVQGIDFRALASEAGCHTPEGCPGGLVVKAEGQAGRSVRNALTAGESPRFEWAFRP